MSGEKFLLGLACLGFLIYVCCQQGQPKFGQPNYAATPTAPITTTTTTTTTSNKPTCAVVGGVAGGGLGFGAWLIIGTLGVVTGGTGFAIGAVAFSLIGAGAGVAVGAAAGETEVYTTVTNNIPVVTNSVSTMMLDSLMSMPVMLTAAAAALILVCIVFSKDE